MAAAVPTQHSLVLGDPDFWEDPNPDYLALSNIVSGAATSNQNETLAAIINSAARSPVAVIFTITGERDYLYVGHTPTVFPADLSRATAFDGLMVVLVGDENSAVMPVVLPTVAFQRLAATRCLDIAGVVGANGFANAGGAVIHQGPHAATVADTAEIRARPVALLPTEMAGPAVENAVNGRYAINAFYNLFLEPAVAAGGADLARIEPLLHWLRVHCTENAAGPAGGVDPVTSASPAENAPLNRWVTRVCDATMAKLGVGGPGLTSAAFAAGVNQVTNALETNKNDTLAYHRAEKDLTFADKHGDALGQRVFRICLVNRDIDLPEVHRLLVKCPKSHEYAVVGALLAERAAASGLPVSTTNAPIVTTRLVNDLFRTYMPGGTGLDFGHGLSPFAIVCQGHHEAAGIQKLVKGASLVEGGASVSLDDTNKLVSNDIRFPTEAYIAVEKLYGWSIMIDVYHGTFHPIATAVRLAVQEICPLLFRLVTSMGDDVKMGMDLV